MKIKMLYTSASEKGVRLQGQVYEVPEAEALELVEGNYAISLEPVKEEETKTPEKTKTETNTDVVKDIIDKTKDDLVVNAKTDKTEKAVVK